MPFTRAQLRRITQDRGQAYIARNRGNYAMRVSETYIRRKLYNLEDRAINQEYALFQQASADIKAYALNRDGIADSAWQRSMLDYIDRRLNALTLDIAQHSTQFQREAYYASYLGRLWVLDSMTTDDVLLNTSVITHNPDLIAQDVHEQYETERLAEMVKIRRALARAVLERWPIDKAAREVSDLGQRRMTPHGLFHRYQLLTRSGIIRQASYGAYYALMGQLQPVQEAVSSDREWVLGMMWLSSRDSRVCPICARLDGTIWLLSELWGLALTEFPPDGSHRGCRCQMIYLLVPNVLKGDNEPPDESFDEWLIANGWGSILDEFMDTGLASTQI